MALTLRNPPTRVPETESIDSASGAVPGAKVYRRKRRSFALPAFASLLVGFLLSAGVGALFIYHYAARLNWVELDHLKWFRLLFVAAFVIVLVATAFQQSPGHGMACVFFPPYMIAYALAFMDSPALRGFIFGIIAWLGAETYYMEKDSFMTACRQTSTRVIADVRALIDRAAR